MVAVSLKKKKKERKKKRKKEKKKKKQHNTNLFHRETTHATPTETHTTKHQ